MKKLISDIKDGINALKKVRRLQLQTTIPVISCSASFYDTVEGCALARCGKEIEEAARGAFRSLPPEERYRLSLAPKDGEFIECANFWRELLEPVLSQRQLRKAMVCIISRYIRIKRFYQIQTSAWAQEGK